MRNKPIQGFDSQKGETAEVMPHNYASGNQIRVPDLQGPIIDHKSGDANISTLAGEHGFAKGIGHHLNYWG